MLDSEIPPEVRAMTYLDRIRWHKDRVQREMPVFDFLDSLDHNFTVIELKLCLVNTRQQITRLEVDIALLEYEGGVFPKLLRELAYHIAMYNTSYRDIKAKHWDEIIKVERHICRICMDIGTEPEDYIRSNTLKKSI